MQYQQRRTVSMAGDHLGPEDIESQDAWQMPGTDAGRIKLADGLYQIVVVRQENQDHSFVRARFPSFLRGSGTTG